MKKLSKRIKITIITDTLLIAIFVAFFAVSFFPSKIVPIYSAKGLAPIYNGNAKNQAVSLMFNVYEGVEIVENIVYKLNQKDIKATFFIGGCWADDNEKTLRKIAESGHEIASHGYFHKDHKKLNYSQNLQEIQNSITVIESLSNVKIKLFAPPSGSFSQDTLDSCEYLGYKLIMWSKDTIDWRDSSVPLIVKRATENVCAGDLILMHPKSHTFTALDGIIENVLQKGLTFLTVSENIA